MTTDDNVLLEPHVETEMESSAEEVELLGPEVSLEDGGLLIDFSSFWKRDLQEYSFFSMSRKRNFANMAERSGSALATLLQDNDFALGLLSLRYNITLPEEDSSFVLEESLPDKIVELFNTNVIEMIGNVVDDAYDAHKVDINTEHGGKNNEELQFTNDHARIILRWSFACVTAAPIITAYMSERRILSRDSMNLIISVFGALVKCFEPVDGSVDVLAKIRKLVESRVLQTRYSDKVIWNYLRNVATDPHIVIDRLFRKFIVEGIPKVDQGSNIIKFFHTFLKKQISFQFTAKFPVSYKPVRQDTMDPDGVGAMEHLESELVRRDEGAVVLGELSCRQAIHESFRDLGWSPDAKEVAFWEEHLRTRGINAWQRGMVTKFFLPKIGRVEHIHTRSLSDYTEMFLATRRWLDDNGFTALHGYMSSCVTEGVDARKLLARKKFIREFVDSAAYRELLGNCFSTTSQSVIDSGVIIEMISAVHIGNFERLPEYMEETSGEVDPTFITHRVETVAQEVLRFISYIAHT